MKTANDTLSVVRCYHRGWTTKRFDVVAGLLSPNLVVEVPINEYPTAETFVDAVAKFGAMVNRLVLLAEFARRDEAMLLYDMYVQELGMLRVAEHFTVADGLIVRIRQIHDTAALRSAGFASQRSPLPTEASSGPSDAVPAVNTSRSAG